jgi:hypothetical protein
LNQADACGELCALMSPKIRLRFRLARAVRKSWAAEEFSAWIADEHSHRKMAIGASLWTGQNDAVTTREPGKLLAKYLTVFLLGYNPEMFPDDALRRSAHAIRPHAAERHRPTGA